MANQLDILKHIPCPSGDSCTSYRCLFRHEGDEKLWPLPSEQGAAAATAAAGLHVKPFVESQGNPRKRIRLGEGDGNGNGDGDGGGSHGSRDTNDEYDLAAPLGTAMKVASKGKPNKAGDTELLKKPVSPPPIKRRLVSQTERPALQPATSPSVASSARPAAAGSTGSSGVARAAGTAAARTAAARAVVVPQRAGSGAKASTAQAARKPETLNPRHLRSAPATHEVRFKILKLLHAELARLNEALHKEAASAKEEKGQQASAAASLAPLLLSKQQVVWLALDLEEYCAVSKPAIYSNVIKNRIMAYKRMTLDQWKKECNERRGKEAHKQAASGQQQSDQNSRQPPPGEGQGGADRPGGRQETQQQQQQLPLQRQLPSNSKDKSGGNAPGNNGNDNTDGGGGDGGDDELTPDQQLSILKAFLLTPVESLGHCGFVPTVPTEADIQIARDAEQVSKGFEVCERCRTRFQVFPGRRVEDGLLASGGSCTHHPGKRYTVNKSLYTRERSERFRCCHQPLGDSRGCVTATHHVFKTTDAKRLASLWNFVPTPPNPGPSPPLAPHAVCFDCEMGYTVYGLEVIRLTATAWPGGEELLDVLVRPKGEIMDLNSRYSGVWPEDFANALDFKSSGAAHADVNINEDGTVSCMTHGQAGISSSASASSQAAAKPARKRLPVVESPAVARRLFFSLFAPDTPLIGHGLDNDLNCMRIVHPTICDTALLYPHPRGLPVRNSLKNLVKTHLGRDIQMEPDTTDAGKDAPLAGHDSAEDARAAGDLVCHKVKSIWADKKKAGWRFVDGQLLGPEE